MQGYRRPGPSDAERAKSEQETAIEAKRVIVELDADDALLLQGMLRNERHRYEHVKNEVICGMLDHVEEALQAKRRAPSC